MTRCARQAWPLERLLFYVTVGACPASLVIGRVFGMRSAVYPREGSNR